MSLQHSDAAGLKGFMQREINRRELKEYPKGRYRILLLVIVVFANIVASYEGNLSPIIPLLLTDLDITATIYGQLNAITLIVTAITAVIFGVYADRWGRSVIILIGVLLTAVFLFLMAGVTTVQGFLFVKILVGIVDGLSLAPIAGLVRDFSPQVGRGLAFAFWSLGPVGGPFLANLIASWTLPIFGTWQSQLYIMATVSVLLWVVIFLFLRDLSPELRANVYVTEPESESGQKTGENNEKEQPTDDAKKIGFSTIFSHPVIWLQPLGIAIFLQLYFTMLVYGPLLFTEMYSVTAAEGSKLTMYFWLGTFFGLTGSGWLSDRLGRRKLCTLGGALLAVTFNPLWLLWGMAASTPVHIVMICSFLSGFTIATAYSPWMALYSENLEIVNPNMQATGWGLFGFAVRMEALAVGLFAPMVVAWTGSWKTWFVIAQVSMMVYLVFPFLALGSFFTKKAAVPSAHEQEVR